MKDFFHNLMFICTPKRIAVGLALFINVALFIFVALMYFNRKTEYIGKEMVGASFLQSTYQMTIPASAQNKIPSLQNSKDSGTALINRLVPTSSQPYTDRAINGVTNVMFNSINGNQGNYTVTINYANFPFSSNLSDTALNFNVTLDLGSYVMTFTDPVSNASLKSVTISSTTNWSDEAQKLSDNNYSLLKNYLQDYFSNKTIPANYVPVAPTTGTGVSFSVSQIYTNTMQGFEFDNVVMSWNTANNQKQTLSFYAMNRAVSPNDLVIPDLIDSKW